MCGKTQAPQRRRRVFGLFLILFAAFSLITGCAHLGAGDPQKALRKRVVKAWEAKLRDDCKTLYEMSSSRYRGKVDPRKHLARCKWNLDAYRVGDIALSADGASARVTVLMDVQHMGYTVKDTQIQESWILENGQWVLDPPPAAAQTPFEMKKPAP